MHLLHTVRMEKGFAEVAAPPGNACVVAKMARLAFRGAFVTIAASPPQPSEKGIVYSLNGDTRAFAEGDPRNLHPFFMSPALQAGDSRPQL